MSQTLASVTQMRTPKVKDLTSDVAALVARDLNDEKAEELLRAITNAKWMKNGEMTRLRDLSDRFDNLYYPNVMTEGGADHWPTDPNRSRPGRAHISVNVYPVYVDVPASLMAVEPVENIVPAASPDASGWEAAAALAAGVERMYFAWKNTENYELKMHKVLVTRGLYGRSAVRVRWDEDEGHPCIDVIDQPRNLWLGWSSSEYTRLDWAIFASRLTPLAVFEEYGLVCEKHTDGEGKEYPIVTSMDDTNTGTFSYTSSMRDWLNTSEFGMVEVHDFWYRAPVGEVIKGVKPKMETRNAILVGNYLLKDEAHPEYDGMLPYVPVFNTYIPGVPDGKSNFYDIEQLVREKDERLSAGATMIAKAIGGQYWQLVGPESPDTTPRGLAPKPDVVVSPGAGNRIEKIEPWMPQFQLDDFLNRIDRELADVSGLNDLLRGLAPAQVLSSGKAINALVANYESRIAMPRALYYEFRQRVWKMVVTVWGNKNTKLKPILEAASYIEMTPPTLTPRDDIETANMAMALMNSKVWSNARAMDRTGVDDPETEQAIISKERTNAAMFPADVQVMAALAFQLQQMQVQNAQMQQAQQAAGQAQASLMAQTGNMQPDGSQMLNAPGEQAPMPPEGMPSNAAPAGAPGPGGLPTGPDYNAVNQTAIKGGEANSRILLQQPLAPGG